MVHIEEQDFIPPFVAIISEMDVFFPASVHKFGNGAESQVI